MDRFIVNTARFYNLGDKYLKSNMDRFIDISSVQYISRNIHLKSNMDRFIEWIMKILITVIIKFKIQYG